MATETVITQNIGEDGKPKRSPNDPRERRRRRELGIEEPVVMPSADAGQLTAHVEEVASTSEQKLHTLPVQGTTGDFIRAVLGEAAQVMLSEGRVIEAFIQALQQRAHSAQQSAQPTTAPAVSIEETKAPVELLSTTPPEPKQRAANDPRLLRRQKAAQAAMASAVVSSEAASEMANIDTSSVEGSDHQESEEQLSDVQAEVAEVIEAPADAETPTPLEGTQSGENAVVTQAEPMVEQATASATETTAQVTADNEQSSAVAEHVDAAPEAVNTQSDSMTDEQQDNGDADDSADVDDKPVRPRRPRGRPPKKATL